LLISVFDSNGGADLQAAVILPRQRFDFDGEPHRLRERGSDGDHTVMRQQTG